MTDNYPITPPPELVESWLDEPEFTNGIQMFEVVTITTTKLQIIATEAARWGADQELEACIDVILAHPGLEHPELLVEVLRSYRRPKPPSLAEEALMGLERTVIMLMPVTGRQKIKRFDIIRRALERLKELEALDD